jgi:hypothetical protein
MPASRVQRWSVQADYFADLSIIVVLPLHHHDPGPALGAGHDRAVRGDGATGTVAGHDLAAAVPAARQGWPVIGHLNATSLFEVTRRLAVLLGIG